MKFTEKDFKRQFEKIKSAEYKIKLNFRYMKTLMGAENKISYIASFSGDIEGGDYLIDFFDYCLANLQKENEK
ncbi:MAG: hypothetical protein LBT79_01725 [Elusimicrobiota bacterium]|nr:hypothetical protein [Elusimicrobiota bacterium]